MKHNVHSDFFVSYNTYLVNIISIIFIQVFSLMYTEKFNLKKRNIYKSNKLRLRLYTRDWKIIIVYLTFIWHLGYVIYIYTHTQN